MSHIPSLNLVQSTVEIVNRHIQNTLQQEHSVISDAYIFEMLSRQLNYHYESLRPVDDKSIREAVATAAIKRVNILYDERLRYNNNLRLGRPYDDNNERSHEWHEPVPRMGQEPGRVDKTITIDRANIGSLLK